MGSYMARPTEVFVAYLKTQPRYWYNFDTGRTAMGLEILSLIKLLEDHEGMVAHSMETISVLSTLLIEQDLMDDVVQWYTKLDEWRKTKFYDDADDAVAHRASVSASAFLPDAELPLARSVAQPCSDQTTDQSSSDSPSPVCGHSAMHTTPGG